MENILEKIREFADQAHGDQMRKYTPERYIVHPVRVMNLCKNYTSDISILAAALLHDVLEDTEIGEDEMTRFLLTHLSVPETKKIIKLVKELTDVYIKKDYPKLNRRSRKAKELERIEKTSGDSQTIKYADIIDNTKEIVTHDPDFARVFLFECRANLRKMGKGNNELYHLATEAVDAAIQGLKKAY